VLNCDAQGLLESYSLFLGGLCHRILPNATKSLGPKLGHTWVCVATGFQTTPSRGG